MSKITKFDRSTLREIRPSLEQALQTVAKEYGIQINIGSMRFSENQFTTRLTVNTTNQPSNTRMPASGPLKVGDKFKKKNTVYEVIGFNPNSPKYSSV